MILVTSAQQVWDKANQSCDGEMPTHGYGLVSNPAVLLPEYFELAGEVALVVLEVPCGDLFARGPPDVWQ